MSSTQGLGDMVRTLLEKQYALKKEELGADARLSKKGMVFETEAYEIPDLGHFCILRMNAFLGLMKMETAVLSVTGKDVPLLNLDWVRAFGKETQIVELYDTQLTPYPDEALAAFDALRRRDDDLPGMSSNGHWYDAILYPCSYHKAGKKLTERLAVILRTAESARRTETEVYVDVPVLRIGGRASEIEVRLGVFRHGGMRIRRLAGLGEQRLARLIVILRVGVFQLLGKSHGEMPNAVRDDQERDVEARLGVAGLLVFVLGDVVRFLSGFPLRADIAQLVVRRGVFAEELFQRVAAPGCFRSVPERGRHNQRIDIHFPVLLCSFGQKQSSGRLYPPDSFFAF